MRLKGNQNIMRGKTRKTNVRIAGVAGVTRRSVNHHRPSQAAQLFDEYLLASAQRRTLFSCFVSGEQFRRRTHPDTKRHRQRARAQAVLLTAAINDRLNPVLQLTCNNNGPDSLGTVHLVSGKTDDITLPRNSFHIHCHRRLCRIAMQNGPAASYKLRDFFNCLHRTDLVIHRHNGNGKNIFIQHILERRQVYKPFIIHGNHINRKAVLLLKHAPGGEDTFVLNGAQQNTPTLTAGGTTSKAQQGKIVRLGCTGGEEDFIGIATDQPCDSCSGGFNGACGFPTEAVIR